MPVDGSTRTSTKLWKNGATFTSNAPESHSTEYGQAPRYRVHHQKGAFQGGSVARIFPVICAVDG